MSELEALEKYYELELGKKLGTMGGNIQRNSDTIAELREEIKGLNERLERNAFKATAMRVTIVVLLAVSVFFDAFSKDQVISILKFLRIGGNVSNNAFQVEPKVDYR